MLYYLRQEVIGDQAEKILEGADSRLVQVRVGSGPPQASPGGRETPRPPDDEELTSFLCLSCECLSSGLGDGVGWEDGQDHLHVVFV